MKIKIPGAVWYDYLDPKATGMHDELGLDAYGYEVRRVGKGTQYLYDMPYDTARELAEYLNDRAWTLLGQDEEGSTHRRALKLAQTILQTIRHHPSGDP